MEDQASSNMASAGDNENPPIFMLNHHCLMHIFSFLEVWEILAMKEVCKWFYEATEDAYRFCRVFDTDLILGNELGKVSEEKLVRFFSKAGKFVKNLLLFSQIRGPFPGNDSADEESDSDEELEDAAMVDLAEKRRLLLILELCPSVKNLEFTGDVSKIFTEASDKDLLRERLANLERVHFYNVSLTDEIVELFQSATKLKSFSMMQCKVKSRFLFQHLSNVTELSLYKCKGLKLSEFEAFCEANPGLEKLTLSEVLLSDDFDDEDNDCVEVISRHLKNLKELRIYPLRFVDYMPLLELPNLIDLELRGIISDDTHFLIQLACKRRIQHLNVVMDISAVEDKSILLALTCFGGLKSLTVSNHWDLDDYLLEELCSTDTLERLEIEGSNVTDDGVFDFVSNCKTLKFINLRFCPRITEELSTNLQSVQHNPPLCLSVHSTQIEKLFERVDLTVDV